jgi:hypothetical protein
VLYMLVERNIQGVNRLYLEAIADWEYATESKWNYTNSAVTFIPPSPTNIITGLDHLEGRRVQVVGDQRFLGTFLVESGQVTLLDGTDTAINVSSAIIGTAWTARIRTMPLVGQEPGSRKRYSSLYVRCLNSSRPIINNKRPPDRDPFRIMNESQDLDIVADYEQEILGWNRTQVIEVKENLPVRTEVIGIYGSVKSNSL